MTRVPLVALAFLLSGAGLATAWKVVTPPSVSVASKPAVGTKAKCIVTGEDFVVSADTVMVTYNGKTYPLCCADCKPTFDKNPAKYAK